MIKEKFTKEYIMERIDKTIEAIDKVMLAEKVILDTKQTYQSFERSSLRHLQQLLEYWIGLYEDLYGEEDISNQIIYLNTTFGRSRC